MKSLALVILGLIMAFGCSLVSMIYGWGLEPKSWNVIIWVGFGGIVFSQLLVAIAKGEE